MPVVYRYDDLANRLLTRCDGAVTHTEVMAHFRQLTHDSRLRPQCDVVLDLSFIETTPTDDQMGEIAATIEDQQDLVSLGRCAVVAPGDEPYRLALHFQSLTWPIFAGVRVFRTHVAALAWLDEPA